MPEEELNKSLVIDLSNLFGEEIGKAVREWRRKME